MSMVPEYLLEAARTDMQKVILSHSKVIAYQDAKIRELEGRIRFLESLRPHKDPANAEADAATAEHLHSQEWSKSVSAFTPAHLRAVADGLANQNSHYKRMAACYAASFDMLDALKGALDAFRVTQRPSSYPAHHWCQKALRAIAKAERAEP